MSVRASDKYDSRNEQANRRHVEQELKLRRRKTEDLILKSPNGTRYKITVSDAGAIVVTSL